MRARDHRHHFKREPETYISILHAGGGDVHGAPWPHIDCQEFTMTTTMNGIILPIMVFLLCSAPFLNIFSSSFPPHQNFSLSHTHTLVSIFLLLVCCFLDTQRIYLYFTSLKSFFFSFFFFFLEAESPPPLLLHVVGLFILVTFSSYPLCSSWNPKRCRWCHSPCRFEAQQGSPLAS